MNSLAQRENDATWGSGQRHLRRRGHARRRGATLIEFAVVSVFLWLPMLMGIMEFGLLVKNQLLLSNATREGARAAATGKKVEVIRQRVADYAAPLKVDPACSPVVTRNCGSLSMTFTGMTSGAKQPLANNATGTNNNAGPGDLITISATARHSTLFRVIPRRDLTVTVTMRRE